MPDADVPVPPVPPSDPSPNTPSGPGSNAGMIVDLQIERELQDSYLTYAMSTIMDRALPDVRDGLKPSQRRILVAMNDLRLTPGKKHLKCAKICGDTSGNYHPHGESVIYPTMVGMAQSWRMRVRLVDPQGNFGSIAPDAPAAMRYTEARMTHAAVDMLEDLQYDTVDMQANYDDRLVEPTVLPGKFPNLLVNGGVGIAVGMATSLAPNNPIEVLDSIVRVIDKPDIGLQELMTDVVEEGEEGRRVKFVGIKGPDFPTGGTILGRRGIVEGYATGRGKVTLRGRVRIEPMEGAKDRHQLVIEQIPYNLGLTTLIDRIRDAIEADKITEISDARDESSAKSPVRIVIELKRGADPAVVEKQLYEYTPLQQTFSINSIALVNRQPRTLGLLETIKYYVEHRVDVIRRRTSFLLAQARKEAHVLEGLIYAVCDIDEVIRLIRASRTRPEAIEALMARRFRIAPDHRFAPLIPSRLMRTLAAAGDTGVALSRMQAEKIGELRLIQLVGLEIEKLTGQYRDIVAQIEEYESILASRERVLGLVKADCGQMRARFNVQRSTEIQDAADDDFNMAALIQVQDMAVTISHAGYAKRVALDTYKQQGRGGKGIIAGTAKDEDFLEHFFVASTHDDLLCFTNTGRVFKIKVYELPEMARQTKGRPLVNIIDLREGEKACAYLNVKNFEAGGDYLTFVSVQGVVKRTALKEYRNVSKAGLIAVGLKEGDALLDVIVTNDRSDVLLATEAGQAIRFYEQDARLMGRPAAGVKGIELAEGDTVVGVIGIGMSEDPEPGPDGEKYTVTSDTSLALLTITEKGYGKRTAVDEYRVQPEIGKARSQTRGGKGRVDIAINDRNGKAVAALGVHETDDIIVVTRQGKLVRMPSAEIRLCGRGTQGVRVARLDEGDTVVAAARVPAESGE